VSRDLLFWKPGPELRTSPGTIALVLGDYQVAGLDPIDEERIADVIDRRFPGWRDEGDDRWKFECETGSTFLSLSLHASTAEEVETWFRTFADSEGLATFDCQVDEITAADKAARRKIVAAAKRELEGEEQDELRAEFGRALARADAGDAAAQLAVGQKLSFGEGVKANPAEAAAWYRRAAEAGNVDAMVNLAALLRNGKGIPRDVAMAARWLERALPSDGLFVAFELGEMYATGEGVAIDRKRAEELFETALANGHPAARKALRLLREGK
jgi:hypothetical protein